MGRFRASLASSTPTRRRAALGVLGCCLAALAAGAVWLITGAPAGGVREGSALDGGTQSAGDVGYEHAQVGEEYWAGLPLPWNTSGQDLEITKAEFSQVPKGVKVIEYQAVNGNETDGNILFARTDGKGGVPSLSRARNYAGHPFTVKAKSGSDIHYVARVKVTGPIRGALKDCRFWYRQGSQQYQQQLDCSTIIRLGPPIKYEN
ncbi:hypothetical protein [Streptomyces sp. NPDC093598]|uniref:hypothetical protein n=1 Tax=Streptomyces sp. NPDC093598 TaxID=3366046 RepID=UPI0038236B42